MDWSAATADDGVFLQPGDAEAESAVGRWVQHSANSLYCETTPNLRVAVSGPVSPAGLSLAHESSRGGRSRKPVFGGPSPKNVKRHDCLGVVRPDDPSVTRHSFSRPQRHVPRDVIQKASSESSLHRTRNGSIRGFGITEVYDDTHPLEVSPNKSLDRLMTRTVVLRRQANLEKAKKLSDLMKRRLESDGLSVSAVSPSVSQPPAARYVSTSTPKRSPRIAANAAPANRTMSPSQTPRLRDSSAKKAEKKPPVPTAAKATRQKAAPTKPSTTRSQTMVSIPQESFRLFEPDEQNGLSKAKSINNQSMPNLLHQTRPCYYSDDSIDGSYADIHHGGASEDSLSDAENPRRLANRRNYLRVDPTPVNGPPSLASAVSLPLLAVRNLELHDVQNAELTPPDSGRKRSESSVLLKAHETQTDAASTHSVNLQTESPVQTRTCLMQTEVAAMKTHSVQTDQLAGRNLHVQTEITGPVKSVVSPSRLRNGAVQTEVSVRLVHRDSQTDVSCMNKSARGSTRRELVLKSKNDAHAHAPVPLNELNGAAAVLQLKHGHREITESDYFMPPQSGQLSPSLSETSNVSDRHRYMKSQPLPLQFVSNRPNIFMRRRRPSASTVEDGGEDQFGFMASTANRRNSADSCASPTSEATVVDSDESAAGDGEKMNGYGHGHGHTNGHGNGELSTKVMQLVEIEKRLQHEASQTDTDNESSSVTINLNVRKSKPIVRSYAYYYIDPNVTLNGEDGKSSAMSYTESIADSVSSSQTYTIEKSASHSCRSSPSSAREYYASEYYKGAIFQLGESEPDESSDENCCSQHAADSSGNFTHVRTELCFTIGGSMAKSPAQSDRLITFDAVLPPKSKSKLGTMITAWNNGTNGSEKDKATARTGSGDQSTEGVHPNALRDPQNCCVVCGKRVYQLEKVAAHKGVYHKSCFRCEVCETTLGPGNFSVLDGHLFCKPHLIQQFKTRGKYETSAAFKAREASASGYRAGAAQNGNAAVK